VAEFVNTNDNMVRCDTRFADVDLL